MKSILNISRKKFIGFLFLTPAFTLLILIVGIPIIYAIYLSFHSFYLNKPLLGMKFIGLQNYSILFEDPNFYNALSNTVRLTIVVVGIEMFFGVSLAILFSQFQRSKFTEIVRTLFLLPMMFTPVIVGILWRMIYNTKYGPLNYLLNIFGLDAINWLGDSATSLWTVACADIWQYISFVFIIAFAFIETIPKDLYEAAKIDGVTLWQEIKYITLPLMLPIMIIILALRVVDVFRIFDKIFVLTMGGPGISSETLTYYTYRVAFRAFNLGYASTIGVITAFILLIISTAYIFFIRGRSKY